MSGRDNREKKKEKFSRGEALIPERRPLRYLFRQKRGIVKKGRGNLAREQKRYSEK